MDMTDGQAQFYVSIAKAIAPMLFEGGGERWDAAVASARISGAIFGELIESGSMPYETFAARIDELRIAIGDEFDKYITASPRFTN